MAKKGGKNGRASKDRLQAKYRKKIKSGAATVSASGISPPIPEFLWDAYDDDAELLEAVRPMTLKAIPFVDSNDVRVGSLDFLYNWMQLREYQSLELIIPTTSAKQNPRYNGQFGNSYQNPNLTARPQDEPRHKDLLDRFFRAIDDSRRNLPTHERVKAAAWFSEMLTGIREGGYISNPIILEIYEFGGGTPWRQLTVEDITNERAARVQREADQEFKNGFDQDVATVENEVQRPAADTYDDATYRATLGGEALTKWDELRAAR